jgi:hypothetical protein
MNVSDPGNSGFPKLDAALLRSLRGPLMVVVVGILFLIDQAGGASFGKTWPVLLITMGLLRLGEYWGARKA